MRARGCCDFQGTRVRHLQNDHNHHFYPPTPALWFLPSNQVFFIARTSVSTTVPVDVSYFIFRKSWLRRPRVLQHRPYALRQERINFGGLRREMTSRNVVPPGSGNPGLCGQTKVFGPSSRAAGLPSSTSNTKMPGKNTECGTNAFHQTLDATDNHIRSRTFHMTLTFLNGGSGHPKVIDTRDTTAPFLRSPCTGFFPRWLHAE